MNGKKWWKFLKNNDGCTVISNPENVFTAHIELTSKTLIDNKAILVFDCTPELKITIEIGSNKSFEILQSLSASDYEFQLIKNENIKYK